MSKSNSFQLDRELYRAAQNSDDAFVKSVQKHLEDFEQMYGIVMRKQISLFYISDEKYLDLLAKMKKTESQNSLTISYMARLIEGFRVLSIMRSAELLKSIVKTLNDEEILAAGILARALLELVVRNLEAALVTYHNFKNGIAWERLKTDLIVFSDPEVGGKRQEGLMTYVDKLVFGTRIKGQTGHEERLSTKNIISILEKMDKELKLKAGYSFFEKYESLCEIAHPNRSGFEIFMSDRNSVDGYWDSYKIGKPAWNNVQAHYLGTILWVVSFCAGTSVSVQTVYDDLAKFVRSHVPKIYPIRRPT
jgi:hypothetical protein